MMMTTLQQRQMMWSHYILIIRLHLDHQVTGEHRSGLINSKSAYFHQVGFLISACLLKNESGLKNIFSHSLNLQEKCSIVFRGDTRDVLILRLTHLALHGPNCSSSLSLSVQVVIDDHSHHQWSKLPSKIKTTFTLVMNALPNVQASFGGVTTIWGGNVATKP